MGKKEAKTKKDKKTKTKKTKATKDKDAPKRAISAFFYFQKERRTTLKKEKPDLANKELISKMSTEWNAMKTEARKPYDELAEQDKKRYQTEKEKYEDKKKGIKSAKKSSVKKEKKEESEDEDEEGSD